MIKALDTYTDLDGREWDLTSLDAEERRLLANLRRRVRTHPDWNDFDNYWVQKVAALYDGRGLARTVSSRKPVYRIAQDLSGRLALSLGMVRLSDYRDDLADIVRTHFKTPRAFCEATGLSEDVLSQVLARRKHLAIETLEKTLDRIGYRIRLMPGEPPNGKKRKTKAG